MRTLAITQNITLDGAIEMIGDCFDPAFQDDDVLDEVMRQSANEEILLLGRQTFTDFRSYWPLQTDDETGVTDHLNQVTKYVVSSTLTDPAWDNSTVVDGDPIDLARQLRAGDGGDVVVTGSIQLTHALLEARVVDELRLFTYPAVQGTGRRLFPQGYAVSGLRLLDVRGFACGITYSAYRFDHCGAADDLVDSIGRRRIHPTT